MLEAGRYLSRHSHTQSEPVDPHKDSPHVHVIVRSNAAIPCRTLFRDRLFNDSVRARGFSTEQDRPLLFSLRNMGDYGGSVEVAVASLTRSRIKG